MYIKLLVSVAEGEIHSLSIPQEMWIDNNLEAHWHIHEFMNKAVRCAQQDEREEYDYWIWWNSGELDDEEDEELMEIA